MTRRRRGPGGPPRCINCKAAITFFGSPFGTGTRRPFNPRPVDPHAVQGAFPVFGGRAYKFAELVEVLQVQRECPTGDAESEVYDLSWHTLHACPTDDTLERS